MYGATVYRLPLDTTEVGSDKAMASTDKYLQVNRVLYVCALVV